MKTLRLAACYEREQYENVTTTSWEKLKNTSPNSDWGSICSIPQMYQEEVNSILPANCFNASLYNVKNGRRKEWLEDSYFLVSYRSVSAGTAGRA